MIRVLPVFLTQQKPGDRLKKPVFYGILPFKIYSGTVGIDLNFYLDSKWANPCVEHL